MQTKSIILASTLSTFVAAAALPANNPDMPTLGGQNWYDWNSASVPTPAASTPVAVASASWSAYTPAAVSSSWSAWTPLPSTTAPVYATTSTSSYIYENPFTVYLTQTDSRGVITGMPSVVTSQPSVVTSQPAVATAVTTQAAQNSTLATSTASSSASFQQTRTASASIAVSTGGAATNGLGRGAIVVAAIGLGLAMW